MRTMYKVFEELSLMGIVPVIALDRPEDAEPLAKALLDGGIRCAEVTFRTAAAEESIRIISEKFPEMLVGAGTVLTTEQVDRAVAAGAKFIIAPGLNPKTVSYCVGKNIPVMPGTANPSDVEAALELGLDAVKFFPAEAAGGLPMIKAMSAPYVNMRFMPTGGIGPDNFLDYLRFKKIVACGGSWMVRKDLVTSGNFAEITRLSKDAVRKMLGFELRHIGINCGNEAAANAAADKLRDVFGFEKKPGSSSVFAGTAVEAMNTAGRGTHGHIAIATNFVDRAVYYLERQGVEFDKSTERRKASGELEFVYLKDEIGGFVYHLVQK